MRSVCSVSVLGIRSLVLHISSCSLLNASNALTRATSAAIFQKAPRPENALNSYFPMRLARFYARDSGLLKFKIQAGLLGRPVNHAVRRLVAFTFHPFEPFAISVQRTNAEYVVNFHMRHVCA